MKVDIVITTYRAAEKLKNCLKAVIEKTKFVDFNIFVWCNDPNEEMKKVINGAIFLDGIQTTDRIIPIFNDNNSGSFSSNNNNAAKEGTGDYILFLNDDVEPLNDDWLYNMASAMEQNEKVGTVGALLLYPDQKTIQHCGVFFSSKTNNLPYHMFYKRQMKEVESFISQYRYYQAVTGACLLVRRKDFEEVNGFGEDYFYCFEDVDLCLKIKNKLNKLSLYCPSAVLIHNEGISTTQPRLQENIAAFKKNCSGKYYNDLEFYLQNQNFMIYKNNIKKCEETQ